MYDKFISLGYNCEAGFNFRRLLGFDDSSYFNWMVTPFDSLISIIQNDFVDDFIKSDLYYKNSNSISMVSCRRYNIDHHSPFVSIQGRLNGDDFEQMYLHYIEKLNHFKEKFYKVVNSDLKVLYFIKFNTTPVGAKLKAIQLRNLFLTKFPNHKFSIVALQELKNYEPDWNESSIFNRYLQRFSPYNNVPDTHIESWDKIFSEFLHSRTQ